LTALADADDLIDEQQRKEEEGGERKEGEEKRKKKTMRFRAIGYQESCRPCCS